MKSAFRFSKIDFSMSKDQNKVYLLFIALAIILSGATNMPSYFIPLYLAFGSVILSTAPFSLENYSNSAFVNLLPASTRSRVTGRYFFSFFYLFAGLLVSELSAVITVYRIPQTDAAFQFIFPLFLLGVAMVFISIQYILLYIVGIGKSNQYMKLICMVPGFIMFGIFSQVSGVLERMGNVESILQLLFVGGILFGILSYIIAIEISIRIVEHRDSI